MEALYSIEDFESGGQIREVNSPRSLDAFLKVGLDPSEVLPKPKSAFETKSITKEQLDIKYNHFERKRKDKIAMVIAERLEIIKSNDRALNLAANAGPGMQKDEKKGPGLIELEERRMEALRRRQEDELNKIIEKEQTMAVLQGKIAKAEADEIKKQKEWEKKKLETKKAEEKQAAKMAAEAKRLEEEESAAKRQLEKEEAKRQAKIAAQRKIELQRIEAEALEAERIRQEKIAEGKRKTEALIQAQFDLAEQNRKIMIEREARVRQQMEEKKEQKRIEVLEAREKATKRIEEAMQKFVGLQEQKKLDFEERQKAALSLAKTKQAEIFEAARKQADEREKKEKTRITRLIDAYKIRNLHRQEIIERRQDKDKGFNKVAEERNYNLSMMKFTAELKIKDKLENVDRVARQTEFRRLRTLKSIEDADYRHEKIVETKEEMLRKHMEEQKNSLIRKHEISDVMDKMRQTNDFSLLEKLFAKKKKAVKGGKTDDAAPEETEPVTAAQAAP